MSKEGVGCNPKISVSEDVLSLCHFLSMYLSLFQEIGPMPWYLNLLNILAVNYLAVHFLLSIPSAWLFLFIPPTWLLSPQKGETNQSKPGSLKKVRTVPHIVACHKADGRFGRKESASSVPQVVMRTESGMTSIHSPSNESSLMRMGNGTNVTCPH